MFPSTFKRGSGEVRPPVWQRPQQPPPPQHRVDAVDPPWTEEAEVTKDMQPTREAYVSSGELNALLGRGSQFEGKLAFEGKVRIDGNFSGEISTSDTLHIGEGARVSAEITCGTVIVEGEVVGNIKAATAVEFHRPAKVRGDVTAPSLMIEKGVIFEGHSRMENLEGSNVVTLRAAAEDD